ncbi:hypothetical protein INR49_007388 [Caranx melampygus]|nr:hypothetical protein INR49_007388 [Caranx melampygus]
MGQKTEGDVCVASLSRAEVVDKTGDKGHFTCRETEYKGLQLSLDQASSKATSFPYSSSSSSIVDSCRTPKSKVSRLKTKARLSPYTQFPSFQTERSESDQDSPWGSSPLTDSASPQLLEQSDGLDASCVYRQFTDPRTPCYSPSEEQHAHTHTHLHAHGGQGQRCERSRCEAGRYFLGAPPPSGNVFWGTARSIIPLSKSSLENHEGSDPLGRGQRGQLSGRRLGQRLRGPLPGRPVPLQPPGAQQDETLIRATQQMIKEEESRLQLRKAPPLLLTPRWGRPTDCRGPPGPLPLQSVVCRGLSQVISPVNSPAPLSRLSSPGSERLHKPKDYLQTDLSPLSLPLHHSFGRSSSCSGSPPPLPPTLYPSHTHTRPYLDKHTAYSLTGYALEHLYDPESLRGYCTSSNAGPPTHYDMTPHLRIPAEQTPAHKGTSVIITNGS